MLFMFQRPKKYLHTKVLYLGEEIDLPKRFDQHEWDQIPHHLNLHYYDEIVMNLTSLSDRVLIGKSAKSIISLRQEFGKFLFQTGTRVLAFGNPLDTFVLEGVTLESTWWLPGKPEAFSLNGDMDTKSKAITPYRKLQPILDHLREAKCHFSGKFLFPSDIKTYLREVSYKGCDVVYSFKEVAVCCSNKQNKNYITAFHVEFHLLRNDGLAKTSGPVFWLPLSKGTNLTEILYIHYNDLIRRTHPEDR